MVRAAITVDGSDLIVDLAGTSPQVDLPINMPFEGTVDIAVLLTVRSILLDTELHEPVPTNSGLFRPIRITAPEGTLANPRFPAPVIARFCSGNAVADTVMRALAQVVPDRVSAGIGHLKVTAFSGLRDGTHWVYMDIMEGSYGGRSGKDGLDAVDTLYANTRNNPIEDIESHYPLRLTRYELTEATGGRGRWRGGLGSIREFEFTEPGGFSIEGDGSKYAPPGLFGGLEGTPGRSCSTPTRLASRCSRRSFRTARQRRVTGCASSGLQAVAMATRPTAIRQRFTTTFSTATRRSDMRVLVINPNTSEEMTRDIGEEARRYAQSDTEIEVTSPAWGPRSIEGHYEEELAAVATLETIRERAAEFDGVVIACYGDPGLFAAREICPVPVVGIAEASMLMACTVAHRFTIVSVLPRVKPMLEDMVRMHGLEARCASIRATPLSVLDCERDPQAAKREIVIAARAAIEEDGAEAICLGCAGMGPLDKVVEAEIGVPVLDGVACAVKLVEAIHGYGLSTSRVAAFKAPEPKEIVNYGPAGVPA